MNTIVQIILAMRPAQWIKNLFVPAPVLFAKIHTEKDPLLICNAILAMVVFILLSGAVYIWNDILDLSHDKSHPIKRNRPIASGALSVRKASVGAIISVILGLVLGYTLPPEFILMAIFYLCLNVLYSTLLKKIPYLEVIIIALGFLIRIVSGCFAIGLVLSEISYHLILCTFLIALFLAIGKRRHELATSNGSDFRTVLGHYRLYHLDIAMYMVATITIISYSYYTISPHTVEYFGTMNLVFTIPFVIFGVFRFLILVRNKNEGKSPTDFMIKDPLFMINILIWAGVAAWAIYG